jgi:PD-(D/E)XK endonuclease
MDTIHRGNAAEAAVVAALAAADIPVFLPFGQGLSFDLVAVTPPRGDLIRVQVKSGRIRKGCVEFNTCSTDHGSGPQPYTGRADVIAVHLPDPNRLFMVPVVDCPVSKGNLRIATPRNNQRRRVRFAADYEFEAWLRGLLGDSAGGLAA